MSEIRLLEEKDQNQVINLLCQLTGDQVFLDIDSLMADPAIKCIVVDDDGAIAGFASLVSYYLPSLGKVGMIEDVVVDESKRGLGYGRNLVERLIEIAKENGLKKLQLTSNPKREAARALYKSLGFEMKDTNVFAKKLS